VFKQKGNIVQDWKQEARERAANQENKAFKRMDAAEANIRKALGLNELTPMQVLILRNEIAAWENADADIRQAQDKLSELA